MHSLEYIIALGGNIGNTEEIFAQSLEKISLSIGEINKKSNWHNTKPLLHEATPVLNQRNYLNGVISVFSKQKPEEVLNNLLLIEKELGRDRSKKSIIWGPRTLDLDIIAAENLIIKTPNLTIPHPEMHKRLFVVKPMLEVCPNWEHPVLKKSLQQILTEILSYETEKYD